MEKTHHLQDMVVNYGTVFQPNIGIDLNVCIV